LLNNKVNLAVKKPIYYLFFIFIFFPYLSFVNLGTDMQPYALLIALLLFFVFRKSFTHEQVLIGLFFLSSVFILFISGLSFISMRSFFNYASLFFVSHIVFKVLKTERINFESFLKITIFVWFAVGLLQTIYDKTLLNFLISGSRTTDNRGVVGLAPEPTFYGIVFMFLIMFVLLSNVKNKVLYISLSVVGIVFLAKSSMAFLFLFIFLFYYLLTHANFKYILFSIVAIFITPIAVSNLLEGSRLAFLLNRLIDDPTKLVLVDASMNDRFFHVYFSIKGFFSNFMIPNGYSSWNGYVSSQLPQYLDYVIIEWFSVDGRIMSGYGAAFYELGLFSLLIPLVILKLTYNLFYDDLKKFFLYFLFINTIMFSAIPIGFSFFAFFIGYLGYLGWKKNRSRYV
jgi:hypothetical protein